MRLFGFTTPSRNELSELIDLSKAGTDAVTNDDEGVLNDHVWLIHVDEAANFESVAQERAARSTDQPDEQWLTLLWVPSDREPLPDDACDTPFDYQHESNQLGDIRLLQQICNCPFVLRWRSRLEEIDKAWLPVNPDRFTQWNSVPAESDEIAHLTTCGTCQSETRLWLKHEWKLRKLYACPTAEQIVAWVSNGDNRKLASHATHCTACIDSVARAIALHEEFEFIDATVANQRRQDVGIALVEPEPWFKSVIDTVSAGMHAILAMTDLFRMASFARRGDGAANETISQRLQSGDSIPCLDDERWIQVRKVNDEYLLRIGKSAARQIASFRVVLRNDAIPVITFEPIDGLVRISEAQIRDAIESGCNQFIIEMGEPGASS